MVGDVPAGAVGDFFLFLCHLNETWTAADSWLHAGDLAIYLVRPSVAQVVAFYVESFA